MGLECPRVDDMHFDIAKESLMKFVEDSCFNSGTGKNDLEFIPIGNELVKSCFKILPNGYGAFLLKNYTSKDLNFQIELKKLN